MTALSRRGVLTAALAGAAAALPAASEAAQTALTAPATLPPPVDPTPRAVVYFAPERFDDLMWENDRTAHRIYGHALQANEPPSGSGIDVWGKKVRWPYMQRMLATGAYHVDHGEGVDFYEVGGSRGCGGLGIWYDDKLWCSRNFVAHRILETGGDTALFEVDYAPWPVDVIRQVSETRAFSLPLGSNFTRMTSTLTSDSDAPLTVGIGIARRKPAAPASAILRDVKTGELSVWGPAAAEGTIGITIKVDPASVAGFAQDAENYLILITVQPGKAFSYYIGAAWDGGQDFRSQAEWQAHANSEHFRF
jgi:hypothetical protein